MRILIKATAVSVLILGLGGCSEDTPPLPPAIPAATLDVVDLYDERTDLARAFRADNMYGVPETWYETAKSIYDAYMSVDL
ncbi:MAG: hypothetical protein RIC29_17450 [Rhodospirillaceae bacterium]